MSSPLWCDGRPIQHAKESRYSFIVACLKYRTNFFFKNSTSSVFLPTKDRGSQDVLCPWKPFRLCIVVLMFVPSIDSAVSIKHGLRTTDYGLGTKYGLGYKTRTEHYGFRTKDGLGDGLGYEQ